MIIGCFATGNDNIDILIRYYEKNINEYNGKYDNVIVFTNKLLHYGKLKRIFDANIIFLHNKKIFDDINLYAECINNIFDMYGENNNGNKNLLIFDSIVCNVIMANKIPRIFFKTVQYRFDIGFLYGLSMQLCYRINVSVFIVDSKYYNNCPTNPFCNIVPLSRVPDKMDNDTYLIFDIDNDYYKIKKKVIVK